MDDLSARVDALSARVDAGFDRVDRRFEQVHQDMGELRQLRIRLNLGLLLAIVAALAAIVARGG